MYTHIVFHTVLSPLRSIEIQTHVTSFLSSIRSKWWQKLLRLLTLQGPKGSWYKRLPKFSIFCVCAYMLACMSECGCVPVVVCMWMRLSACECGCVRVGVWVGERKSERESERWGANVTEVNWWRPNCFPWLYSPIDWVNSAPWLF